MTEAEQLLNALIANYSPERVMRSGEIFGYRCAWCGNVIYWRYHFYAVSQHKRHCDLAAALRWRFPGGIDE